MQNYLALSPLEKLFAGGEGAVKVAVLRAHEADVRRAQHDAGAARPDLALDAVLAGEQRLAPAGCVRVLCGRLLRGPAFRERGEPPEPLA